MDVDQARAAHGVVYTPAALAETLAEWAVRRDTRRLLDPSFGDGAMLAAGIARLRSQGLKEPGKKVWGVEIDPLGRERVRQRGLGIPGAHLRTGDFLAHSVADLGGPFDTVIGNPPYVRHHRLSAATKLLGRRRALEAGIQLGERSDAWAYFCAHLVGVLSDDGRLAVLLPGSILHAGYALPLLHALGAGHGHTHLIRIQSHQFPGVQERTVVLLIDRASRGSGEVEYREAADLDALRALLSSTALSRRPPRKTAAGAGNSLRAESRLATRLRWQLQPDEARAWARLSSDPRLAVLGEVAQIRIGVVTGANKWFVRSAEQTAELNVPSVPVVSRAAWLYAPVWRASDQESVAVHPSRLLTLAATHTPTGALVREIDAARTEGIHLRHHCAARRPWWSLADLRAPELFLAYMGATAPRIVLNTTTATCTNSIHRLWRKPNSPSAGALVLGSWTSVWRLSAELYGRSYGGGVLKLEPGEAIHLLAPIVPGRTDKALARVEACARVDGIEAACKLADRLVLKDALGLPASVVSAVRSAAARLEARRLG
jgi:adenine-specific DNA-methyltransferase